MSGLPDPFSRRREERRWVEYSAVAGASLVGTALSWLAVEALTWLSRHWLEVLAVVALSVVLLSAVAAVRRAARPARPGPGQSSLTMLVIRDRR